MSDVLYIYTTGILAHAHMRFSAFFSLARNARAIRSRLPFSVAVYIINQNNAREYIVFDARVYTNFSRLQENADLPRPGREAASGEPRIHPDTPQT